MFKKNDAKRSAAQRQSSIAERNDAETELLKMKQNLDQNVLVEQQKLVPCLANIQYFLASFCDQPFCSSQSYNSFPARCYLVDEVKDILQKLSQSQLVSSQTHNLNVIISVLKEFFQSIPGGLFNNMVEYFCEISLESSLQITIMYLHSIIHELPNNVHLVSYLLCKALKNICIATTNEHILFKTYTDILMHFTPVLFPSTLGDVNLFLRSARLLLVMVDYCEQIFHPLPVVTDDNDNLVSEEDCFFKNILTSLQNLEATLACDDSGVESEPEEVSSPMSIPNSPCNLSSMWSSGYKGSSSSMDDIGGSGNHLPNSFYHFTYIESDDQLSPTDETFSTQL